MNSGCFTSEVFSPTPKPLMLRPVDTWRATLWAALTLNHRIVRTLEPRYYGFQAAYSIYVDDYAYTNYLDALGKISLDEVLITSKYARLRKRSK